MAKTTGVSSAAALLFAIENTQPMGAITRRVALFFRRWQDRHIERFIQERGGVITDGTEREIGRIFGLGR
jgi:hypothetical protein